MNIFKLNFYKDEPAGVFIFSYNNDYLFDSAYF